VTIIAPTNLPATMAGASSLFYSRNIAALALTFVKDGALTIDFTDEVARATVITHGGEVVQEETKALIAPAGSAGARPPSPGGASA